MSGAALVRDMFDRLWEREEGFLDGLEKWSVKSFVAVIACDDEPWSPGIFWVIWLIFYEGLGLTSVQDGRDSLEGYLAVDAVNVFMYGAFPVSRVVNFLQPRVDVW